MPAVKGRIEAVVLYLGYCSRLSDLLKRRLFMCALKCNLREAGIRCAQKVF